MDTGFRPRYGRGAREYRYRIWNGPRSPLRERYALGVRERARRGGDGQAAQVFVGRHDFSAFGGKDRQPVRTLHRVEVRRQGALVTIEVVGDAFLRQMVRRIVAALLRVGHGQATVDGVWRRAARPEAGVRRARPPRPHGLSLWRVDDSDDGIDNEAGSKQDE